MKLGPDLFEVKYSTTPKNTPLPKNTKLPKNALLPEKETVIEKLKVEFQPGNLERLFFLFSSFQLIENKKQAKQSYRNSEQNKLSLSLQKKGSNTALQIEICRDHVTLKMEML